MMIPSFSIMKTLVINGDCLEKNTSANLCHLAYIKGLLELGHEVTLLSADGKDYTLDPAMKIPDEVKQYTYYGITLYEKLSLKKKRPVSSVPITSTNSAGSESKSNKKTLQDHAKKLFLSLYGVHGIYAKFARVAKRFRSDNTYDYVLSVSTPPSSHLLAHNLLKSGHIKATHWIQIWEDPWYSDAYGFNGNKKIYKEEQRLLSFAERVCYVSPLTLLNQQRLYPESAHKMYWQPLPYYYKGQNEERTFIDNTYGYFGNYYKAARDLKPFYEAAINTGIKTVICGDPSNLFTSTNCVQIFPRLSLNDLQLMEENTNVLVFLCNRKGGQIPGKIYQYSATSKTILFILDGNPEEKQKLKEYFGRFNRYVFCENNVEDIIRAITKIEQGELGDVINEPLEAFNPKETVQKVLEG